jgi:SPOR domain
MSNSNFRSDRGRDPLAELARLIGQGDPSAGEIPRQSHRAAAPRATAAHQARRTPEERYDPAASQRENRYAPQPSSDPHASSDYRSAAQDRYQDAADEHPGYQEGAYQERAHQDQNYSDQGSQRQTHEGQTRQAQAYQNQAYQEQEYPDQAYQEQVAQPDQGFEEVAGSRFFSGPAAQFNGFREEPSHTLQRDGSQQDYGDTAQMPSARDLAVFPFAADDQGYQGDDQHYADDEAAAADQGHRRARSFGPRTALVAAMAVFGLIVVGSAGAFGYRAMFGGSVLPMLPPIIKASSGPNKIALDPQAGAAAGSSQAVATTGSTENLVSREEQPVAIETPKAAPRVVATIPVVGSGQNSMSTGINGTPTAAAQTGPNRIASADPPWPAVAPAAAGPAAAAPSPPARASSEPKKIRTVTIRTDQTGAVPDGATGSATAAGAARPQSRTAAAPKPAAPPAGGGAVPMSIIPGQGDAAPAPRARTAVASAPSAAPSSGGGSYVQVTSRRTEGEAQTEFHALQGKYPDQLNGREAVIRRADLGEKGTFYRAYVGPFASPEEAAQLCSGLKAAGGNCIVQRN